MGQNGTLFNVFLQLLRTVQTEKGALIPIFSHIPSHLGFVAVVILLCGFKGVIGSFRGFFFLFCHFSLSERISHCHLMGLKTCGKYDCVLH